MSEPTSRAVPPTADSRRRLGLQGEDLACRTLTESGLEVIARNWRPGRLGEIDIVARAHGLLVFCEVKTRSGDAYGSPAASVTPAKQQRLRLLAAAWLATEPHESAQVRFDVVAIRWRRGTAPIVEHLAGVC